MALCCNLAPLPGTTTRLSHAFVVGRAALGFSIDALQMPMPKDAPVTIPRFDIDEWGAMADYYRLNVSGSTIC
jgi:hypothetical protein